MSLRVLRSLKEFVSANECRLLPRPLVAAVSVSVRALPGDCGGLVDVAFIVYEFCSGLWMVRCPKSGSLASAKGNAFAANCDYGAIFHRPSPIPCPRLAGCAVCVWLVGYAVFRGRPPRLPLRVLRNAITFAVCIVANAVFCGFDAAPAVGPVQHLVQYSAAPCFACP